MKTATREQRSLPVGYCNATLRDIVEWRIDQAPPASRFIYFDIGSVDRDSKSFVGLKELEAAAAPSRAKQRVRASDVLVSLTRPNLNAVALVPDKPGELIASTGFQVLRSPWVEPRFIYYLVQGEPFVDAMTSVVQGALYPAVRPKDVLSYSFSMPPRPEQSRIVDKLEELLSDLDAGVAELKAAQRKLALLRQSLLKAAVEGALTADWRAAQAQPTESGAALLQRILTERRARWEQKQRDKYAAQGKTPPKGWQAKYPEPVAPDTTGLPELPEGWVWATIDQLTFVVRGASPRPAGDPRYFGGEIPWITVGSITSDAGMYVTHTEQFVTEAGREASRFVEVDTLLLTNSGATLGVPKITRIGGCINDGSVALLDVDEPVKTYLYWFLSAQTKRLRALNQGAAQPNLNTEIVKRITVPVPPFEEALAVNKALDRNLEALRAQTEAIARAVDQSTAQRKNLLRAAFAGQLVPQDPNDEPASELLARIRAARAVVGARRSNRVPRARTTR